MNSPCLRPWAGQVALRYRRLSCLLTLIGLLLCFPAEAARIDLSETVPVIPSVQNSSTPVQSGKVEDTIESAPVPSEEIRRAQLRKLDAERAKLELETREIDRRLNAKWWEDQRVTQYALSLVIAAALLFAWFKVYVEPLLNQKSELNTLREQINSSENELLEAKAQTLEERAQALEVLQMEAVFEKDLIAMERDSISLDAKSLEEKKKNLELVVAGLKLAADQADKGKGKFYSFMNSNDPIYRLKSYG
jgi:hypothetical protein